jgi:hypothetical protein
MFLCMYLPLTSWNKNELNKKAHANDFTLHHTESTEPLCTFQVNRTGKKCRAKDVGISRSNRRDEKIMLKMSRWMSCSKHKQMTNAYKILAGKPDKRRLL